MKVDGIYGSKTTAAVQALQREIGMTGKAVDGDWGPQTMGKFLQSRLKHYSTGGLADFTGPAWLDGTKSSPELILNARDTENFIALKDILSSFMRGPTQQTVSGDNYFDIDINVEEISNDYDVDQMAQQIRSQIVADASYRNVNAINFLR